MDPKTNQPKMQLSWKKYMRSVRRMARALYHDCGRKYSHFILVGIPRGGALLAYLLSYQLKQHRMPCTVVTSVGKTLPVTLLMAKLEQTLRSEEKPLVVIVDDIADSGGTLSDWASAVGKTLPVRDVPYVSMVMIERSTSKFAPAFKDIVLSTDHWVVFPYETQ